MLYNCRVRSTSPKNDPVRGILRVDPSPLRACIKTPILPSPVSASYFVNHPLLESLEPLFGPRSD
jgi:hypothetical protein